MGAEVSNVKSVWINGALRFQNSNNEDLLVIGATTSLPFGQYYITATNITAATTLAPSTGAGVIVYTTTDAVVVTLPAVAVSTTGIKYTIMNTASDGGAVMNLKSASVNDWIRGYGGNVTTNLCANNTKTTHRMGDMISVICSGSTTWNVSELVGTWAIAATT